MLKRIKFFIDFLMVLESDIDEEVFPPETVFIGLESNIDEILPLETVFIVLESKIDEILPPETVFIVLESNIDEI